MSEWVTFTITIHIRNTKDVPFKPRTKTSLRLGAAKLGLDLVLGEGSRVPPEHHGALLHGHADLLLADGHHALGQPGIVLAEQRDRHEEVVDVVEDQGAVRGVRVLGLEEGHGVLAPVPHGVEMMRGVVPVVEAVTVALMDSQSPALEAAKGARRALRRKLGKAHTGTSSKVMLDR